MRLAYRTVVRKRAQLLFILIVALYGALGLRLTYVQFWKASRYVDFGEKIRNRKLDIQAQRGVIYDRVGRELAMNLTAASIFVHPKQVRDRDRTTVRLASLLECDQSWISGKLQCDKKFVWLKRGADDELGKKVVEADLTGVGVSKEQKRIYPSGVDPAGNLLPYGSAAQVIGFTNIDGKGAQGIEAAWDRYLKGRNGFLVAEVDKGGRVIPETRRASVKPHDGLDVVLTIDAYIQHVAEEALRKTFEANKARGATAIVLDPKTGEILAMANMPTFNPNNRTGSTADSWRIRAITDLYEPGSTLKAMTAAAALEEGLINPSSIFARCSGVIQVGGRRVRCVLHRPYEHGHGAVNLEKFLTYSCNIGATELGLKLGPRRLYKYEQAFGLNSVPRSGLPGEIASQLERPSSWPNIKTANVAFGQGIAVTPLQLACAYGAIANGGTLMRPTIIKETRTKEGILQREWEPTAVRRVVSETTAAHVTKALTNCVDEGTGKTAAVEGYTVAGKTGSAQKVRADGRGYQGGAYVASFVGFLPASDPKIVILVAVDEPKGVYWGSVVAAPAFQEIATKTMWYLRAPRDAAPQPPVRVVRRDTA